MREVACDQITLLVANLCKKANIFIPDDINDALERAYINEVSEEGRLVLKDLLDNIVIARDKQVAACQDTGMAVVFVEIGQDVHIVGGSLFDAISNGVSQGYREGFFRASIVNDPVLRVNTNDNTPPVVHYDIRTGDVFRITVAPKGFGSENMSAMKMLRPSDGIDGIIEFIVKTVDIAGANPCPPIIVGVGIGGSLEKAALLAKSALLRDIGSASQLEHIATIEKETLLRINRLGIGPGGIGGSTTAIAVHIEVYPTHIAGLPVVVNIGCHATRHATGTL